MARRQVKRGSAVSSLLLFFKRCDVLSLTLPMNKIFISTKIDLELAKARHDLRRDVCVVSRAH